MFSCEYATPPRRVSTIYERRASSAREGRRRSVAALRTARDRWRRHRRRRRRRSYRALLYILTRRSFSSSSCFSSRPRRARSLARSTQTVCMCFGLCARVSVVTIFPEASVAPRRTAPRRVVPTHNVAGLPSSLPLVKKAEAAASFTPLDTPVDVGDNSARRTAHVLYTALKVIAPVFSCLREDRVTRAYDSRARDERAACARARSRAASVCVDTRGERYRGEPEASSPLLVWCGSALREDEVSRKVGTRSSSVGFFILVRCASHRSSSRSTKTAFSLAP